jgi:hypothetical protein
LWESYRERLGSSEFSHILFDLSELLSVSKKLESLEEPFSKDKITSIIHDLPLDKSPGPDGFNGDFLKKYWPIVQKEFFSGFL